MKKRILSIFLTLCMVLCLVPLSAFAATPIGTPLTQELIEKSKGYDKADGIQLPTGDYYLTDNVYLAGDDTGAWALLLLGSENITLDLNGYVLDLRGANICTFGGLTLKDSNTGGKSHKFRVEESGLWVWDETNGTKTVTGGVITGGESLPDASSFGSFGGGVYACMNSTFNMAGGSIVGCTAINGGGVYADMQSTFNMTGGSIIGCTATWAGGVYANMQSTFNMTGGSIANCTATNGGGVHNFGAFTMEDGNIENCTATVGGGLHSVGAFTVEGGSIENCTATQAGGGVYIGGSVNNNTMAGGSIVGCAASLGGGVYVDDSCPFTMEDGSIENCTATQAGGGVYACMNSTFNMTGGSIVNCNADEMSNAAHVDGTFINGMNIDKSLLSGINGGQTGAVGDPILIGSAEGLKDFRDKVNGGKSDLCAKLLCDIVLNDGTFDADGKYKNGSNATAVTWTPIGNNYNPYSGTFDGGGHTIKGLYVKDQQYAGLFGCVKTDSYGSLTFAVKNLTVTGYIGVSSSSAGNVYAGGIIGCAKISPYGDGAESGAISGCVNRVVINASSTGDGFSDVYAGGIVGSVEMSNYSDGTATTEIINCANHAAITARSENGSAYAGGIAGQINGSNSTQKINSCFNAGEIRASYGKWSACAGGIIGYAFNGMTAESSVIANCLNVGKVAAVKGSTNAGGIAGKAYTVPISNCCNAGKVDGISDGGIAGNVSGGATVSNCYYLEGTAGWGYNATQEGLKTRAEFADGTVLKLLQNGNINSPWTKCGYLESAKMVLPMFAWQTADVQKYDISVADSDGKAVQITALNKDDVLGDGKVSFEYDLVNDKGILTLNGANLISGTDFPIKASKMENLEIVLKGKNKIQAEEVCVEAENLTFSGDGSIEITNNFSFAVDCTGAVTVNGGDVKISAVNYALCLDGALTVNGGTLELIAWDEYGCAIDVGWSDLNVALVGDRIMITGENPDGSDTRVTAVSEKTVIKAARYVKIFYKYIPVTYNAGKHGKGNTSTQSKIYGTDIALSGAVFTRKGYKQAGWALSDGGNKVYELGAVYSADEPLTLYPVWQIEQYGITYDLGGGNVTGNPDGYNVESDSFTLKNPVRDDGYAFTGWSGTDLIGETNTDVTVPKGSTGDRSYKAHWRDILSPNILGIENGKTYCLKAEFTVIDNGTVESVTVNGTPIRANNGKYTLSPANGEQKVVAKDSDGNRTEITVTVNDDHTYGWQSANGKYWKKCSVCNHETAPKDIPTITINGEDKVCRTQDYKFEFTLPAGATDAEYGFDFNGLGADSLIPTEKNGIFSGVIKSADYEADEDVFELTVKAETNDGFEFTAKKTVTVLNKHTGGKATCKDKAVCDVCGENYGELDAKNHTDLKHFSAKAATAAEEGNIEYWYCSDCDKYFSDSDGINEIAKANTVIAKIKVEEKQSTSPKTNDKGNLSLWIALLFVGGGTAAVAVKKKKRS